jgi:5S rRNA maturation endonuclease (ribonuclease M5)
MKDRKLELAAINTQLSLRMEELLEFLGVDLDEFTCTDEEIRGPGPCHAGDNNTGFSIELQMGRWACWTGACHEQFGTDILGLMRAITRKPFSEVVNKAKEFLKGDYCTTERIEQIRAERDAKRQKRKEDVWKEHNTPVRIYPESALKRLIPPETWCEERSLSLEIFKEYGIGYATRGPMWDRIVIPIRNIHGQIVGFSGRKVQYVPERDIKWFHYKKGEFRKGIHLFNLDRAFKETDGTYILVEGPLDVLKLEEAGIHNSIAVLGRSITDGQIEILKKIGAMRVLVAFDADKRGAEGTESVLHKLENNLFYSGIIDLKRAYPSWNEKELGGLDWANKYVPVNRIPDIIKEYTYDHRDCGQEASRQGLHGGIYQEVTARQESQTDFVR